MHKDFEKILKYFVAFYKEKGRELFDTWVQKLKLDTSKAYGPGAFKEGFESFRLTSSVIKAIKEDQDHKFYKCEVCFALESRNGHFYTREQIVRGARTLSGLVPNWNHTGIPVEGVVAVDAEEKDGIVEAEVAVRRDAKNLHGHLVTDCLDLSPNVPEDEHIIHVSPEGNFHSDEAFFPTVGRLYFTGWAFLERRILPGIPLTRFIPIEDIRKKALVSNPPPPPVEPTPPPAVVKPAAEVKSAEALPLFKPSIEYRLNALGYNTQDIQRLYNRLAALGFKPEEATKEIERRLKELYGGCRSRAIQD